MITVVLSAIWFFYCPVVLSASEEEKLIGDTSFEVGSWMMELIPDDQVYPSYVADPRRPRMHIGVGYVNTDIPEITGGIIMLDAGTRFTLLKMRSASEHRSPDNDGNPGGLR